MSAIKFSLKARPWADPKDGDTYRSPPANTARSVRTTSPAKVAFPSRNAKGTSIEASARTYWVNLNTYGRRAAFGEATRTARVKNLLEIWAAIAGALNSRWTIHANHVEADIVLQRGISLSDFVANLKCRSAADIAAETGVPARHLWAPGYDGKARSPSVDIGQRGSLETTDHSVACGTKTNKS